MMHRRSLIHGFYSGSAFALAGCTSWPASSTVATIAADAAIVLSAVQNVMAALQRANLPGLNTSTLAQIEAAVGGIRGAVEAIRSAVPSTTPTDLAGIVGSIAGYLNAITAALAALPFVPPAAAAYLNAATIIVPVLAAAVQITVSLLRPPTPLAPIPSVEAARAVATTPPS